MAQGFIHCQYYLPKAHCVVYTATVFVYSWFQKTSKRHILCRTKQVNSLLYRFFFFFYIFFSVFWGLWKELLCKRQLPSISTLSQLMAQSWLQVKLGYNVKFMGTLPFFMNGKIKEQVGAKSCQKRTADKRVKKGTWNIFLCTLTITISPSVISLLCITE